MAKILKVVMIADKKTNSFMLRYLDMHKKYFRENKIKQNKIKYSSKHYPHLRSLWLMSGFEVGHGRGWGICAFRINQKLYVLFWYFKTWGSQILSTYYYCLVTYYNIIGTQEIALSYRKTNANACPVESTSKIYSESISFHVLSFPPCLSYHHTHLQGCNDSPTSFSVPTVRPP